MYFDSFEPYPDVQSFDVQRNHDKLVRPFENHGFAGHFVFSSGHLLLNAGYDGDYNYVFYWEETYQAYLAWKAGYTIYAPNDVIVWHRFDSTYRPVFLQDMNIKHAKV